MFKRVGKEIRTWAKVLVILQMIPVVLAGIACAVAGFMYDTTYGVIGVLAGILFIVLSYLFIRLGVILLYSWGELVERVVRIDEKLENMEKQNRPVPVAPAPYAPPAYSYAPPAQPPVVQPAPVVSTPIPEVPVNNPPVPEDDYTMEAVSNPAPVKSVKQEWTCPNCGQVNSPEGSWCRNCGTKRIG